MRKIDVIFVTPQEGTPWQRFVDAFIQMIILRAEKGKYSHAALRFDDYIYEAAITGIVKSPRTEYDTERVKEVFTIYVTNAQYAKAKATAELMLGTKYGWDDCVIGGIHDLFGDDVSNKVKWMNFKNTIDCSAFSTTVLREIFPEFLADENPCEITPETEEQAMEELANDQSNIRVN